MQREATRFHLTIVALGPVGASIDEAIALVPGLSALRPGAPLRRAGWKRSDFFFDLPGGHDGLGIHVTVRAVLRESDSVPIERHVSDCDVPIVSVPNSANLDVGDEVWRDVK